MEEPVFQNQKLLSNCKTCNKQGLPIINTMDTIFTTIFVNEMWEADLIGLLKGSEGQSFFILVVVAHLANGSILNYCLQNLHNLQEMH